MSVWLCSCDGVPKLIGPSMRCGKCEMASVGAPNPQVETTSAVAAVPVVDEMPERIWAHPGNGDPYNFITGAPNWTTQDQMVKGQAEYIRVDLVTDEGLLGLVERGANLRRAWQNVAALAYEHLDTFGAVQGSAREMASQNAFFDAYRQLRTPAPDASCVVQLAEGLQQEEKGNPTEEESREAYTKWFMEGQYDQKNAASYAWQACNQWRNERK